MPHTIPRPSPKAILVTASDAGYFGYSRGLLRSALAAKPSAVDLGFLDLGLGEAERAWLAAHGVARVDPTSGLDLAALKEPPQPRTMGYLARPFLRDAFPGYDVYVWIDADAWLQGTDGLAALIAAAHATGAACIHENERAYRFWPWLLGWRAKHFARGYGPIDGARLWASPHINNGVFAMRADAPHWDAWRRRYQRALERTGIPAPHDQFALNAAVHLDGAPTDFLPATHNWICDLATPMWSEERDAFCAPYAPHAPIAVMHLAGPAKMASFDVRTTRGRILRGKLTFDAERVLS